MGVEFGKRILKSPPPLKKGDRRFTEAGGLWLERLTHPPPHNTAGKPSLLFRQTTGGQVEREGSHLKSRGTEV